MVAQLLVQVDVSLCAQVTLLWLWKLVVKEALNQAWTCIGYIALEDMSQKEPYIT